MTLNRELPPIEEAAAMLNTRHRYEDMYSRRQEAILAGRSLLNVEQMASVIEAVLDELDSEPTKSELGRAATKAAEAIRAAQLGEHA